MSWNDVDFDASYDSESIIYVEFETFNTFDSWLSVAYDFDIDVCIDGNSAVFNIDVQAYDDHGGDTATELNLAVFVEDGYSSIVATGYALVA